MAAAVSQLELGLFVRQVQAMLDAGVPLLRALDFYAEAHASTPLGGVIDEVCDEVRSGYALSLSLAKHPKVFDKVFIGLVRAGEKTGSLHMMLGRLSELIERQVRLRRLISSAMAYPFFVVLMGAGVLLMFIFFILPTLESMFLSIHVELPLPTRVLIVVGRFLRNPVCTGSLIAILVESYLHGPLLLARLRENKRNRLRIDGFFFFLPIIGPTYRKIVVSRVMHTMATALDVGLTLTQALESGADAAGNEYMVNCLENIFKSVSDGNTLVQSMEEMSVFPNSTIPMLAVGEELGTLSMSMGYLANLFEQAAEYSIGDCISTLEPILLLSVGIMAGFLVLASILPLVKLIQSF